MSKLPSSYRAEHEAIVRDLFHFVGVVQMSIATGKQGMTHTAILDWLKATLERAGAEPAVDLYELMAAAKANEDTANRKKQQPQEPELRVVR